MSRICIAVLIIALLSVQAVLAHFSLDYPKTRGFDETKEPTAPCGGFDTVASTRSQVPLSNAFVEISAGHTSYSYKVSVIVNNNPTVADFSTNQLVEVATGNRNYPEAACLSLDLGKNTAIKAGTNATIQVIFNGGDGLLYQCADVAFTANPSGWNNSMCVNADGSATSSAPGSSGSAVPTQAPNKAASLTVTGGLMLLAAICVSFIII